MFELRITRVTLLVAALAMLILGPVSAAVSKPKSAPGGIGTGSGETNADDEKVSSSDGVFPVVGGAQYGDGLGAGRNHQGQDLLAKCGKPVVAAQDGRVRVQDYQSAAGNYVVIRGSESKTDTVYMHMVSEARVSVGDRVEAGETIGRVGTTGSSTACHLHFEMWSAPGWYKGGDVLDPTPHLKRWEVKQR